MKNNKSRNPRGEYKYAGLGIELVVSTLIGALGGYWLDKYLHSSPWFLLAGIFLGSAAGFFIIFRELSQDKNREE